MKRLLMIFLLTTTAAGCMTTQPTILTKTEHVVVMPPDAMFYCPQPKYPSSEGLTDGKVAVVLLDQSKALKQCKKSNDSIKIFLEESKKRIETE